MLREMVAHVSLKTCHMKPASKTRSFYDIYEGKLKHTFEIETDNIQGLARCFDDTEDALKNKALA